MHVTYIVTTCLAALAIGYAAILNFSGAESVKVVADRVRVPRSWMVPFGMLLVCGAAGLLSGLAVPFVRPALVNAAAGAVVAPHGRLFSVMAFTVEHRKIVQIDSLVDPERLAQLDLNLDVT